MNLRNSRRIVALGLLGLAVLAGVSGCPSSQQRVVLYCAQDREFAENLLEEFTQGHGLKVAPKFDTEADKSISLYTEIANETDRPRCDVFWNNEIVNTILLQQQGLLEPYDSPSAKPYPASAKAEDHSWHAFATRARILIVNTDLVKNEADWPKSLLDLTAERWKGRVAMSKPWNGTSGTQTACLFEVLGPEEAKRFYRGLRDNKIAVVAGNKNVAEGVGVGQYAVGITDTDDAIAEVRKGKPVAIIYPDRDRPKSERMGTLFIPNTLAIIKGCPNPAGARKLVDYLLTPEVEKKLAESDAVQVPLNPNVKAELPPQIRTPAEVKVMDVDFAKAATLWKEANDFVHKEFDQ